MSNVCPIFTASGLTRAKYFIVHRPGFVGCARRDLFSSVPRYLQLRTSFSAKRTVFDFVQLWFRVLFSGLSPQRRGNVTPTQKKSSWVQSERLCPTRSNVKTPRDPQKIVNKTYWFRRSFRFCLQLKTLFRVVRALPYTPLIVLERLSLLNVRTAVICFSDN